MSQLAVLRTRYAQDVATSGTLQEILLAFQRVTAKVALTSAAPVPCCLLCLEFHRGCATLAAGETLRELGLDGCLGLQLLL